MTCKTTTTTIGLLARLARLGFSGVAESRSGSPDHWPAAGRRLTREKIRSQTHRPGRGERASARPTRAFAAACKNSELRQALA